MSKISRTPAAPLNTLDLIELHHLFASSDLVLDSLVTLTSNLWCKVKVDKLAFLWSPFAVGVTVVDNLIRASITDFGGGVGNSTVG